MPNTLKKFNIRNDREKRDFIGNRQNKNKNFVH